MNSLCRPLEQPALRFLPSKTNARFGPRKKYKFLICFLQTTLCTWIQIIIRSHTDIYTHKQICPRVQYNTTPWKYTGVRQNNGNIRDTVQISLLIWCWVTLPGMDSYKFWTVSSWILYYSSWRTSSSCFRDIGGGNLFLTLVYKTDQSVSVLLKFGIVLAREDAEVQLHALQTITIRFQLCQWEYCRLGKLHQCLKITSGSCNEPNYPICPSSPFQ
jgi:hypothetical protein